MATELMVDQDVVRLGEVRTLKLEPGEILAIVLPEGASYTAENVEVLRRYFHRWGMDEVRYMVFPHGTELVKVKEEPA